MRSQIVLIRHGITTGNEMRMYYGRTDVPLTERGISELRELATEGVFPDSPDAQYFTTGMLRTEQTLEVIYGNKPHGVIEDLRELDFGEFEMHTYEELNSRPEYQAWVTAKDQSIPPPRGESISEFSKRIARGFKELRSKNELLMLKLRNHGKEALTICVCHGGVISMIMDQIWPDKTNNIYEWIPNPGHGYILDAEDGAITGKRKF